MGSLAMTNVLQTDPCGNNSSAQLTLLSPAVRNVDGQKRHDVGFKQVSLSAQLLPNRQSIKPGKCWQIVAANGGSKWQFPIQFTQSEARCLLPYLQALDCLEFDDRGVPIQVRRIHAAVESMVTGKGGISGAIASRLALNKTTQKPAKPGSFSECSTAFELMIEGVK